MSAKANVSPVGASEIDDDEVYSRMRNLTALVDLLQLATFSKEEIASQTLVSACCMMQEQLSCMEELLRAQGDAESGTMQSDALEA